MHNGKTRQLRSTYGKRNKNETAKRGKIKNLGVDETPHHEKTITINLCYFY
jgi:hypothetical protein